MLNLDTHILIHALRGDVRPAERTLLAGDSWGVAAIVLWELAKLVQLGRITLDLDDPEVERTLRITDGVLRYISVQQEHTGLPQPRVRESYRRDDVPLNEMRSHGSEPEAAVETEPGGEVVAGEPSEQIE